MKLFYPTKLLSYLLCFMTFSAFANDFTCPNADELQQFHGGGYFALKASDLDEELLTAKEKDIWLIGKSKITETGIAFFLTHVKPKQDDASPFHALDREVAQLQLSDSFGNMQYLNNFSYHLCTYYTKSGDPSAKDAFFMHFDRPNGVRPNILTMFKSWLEENQ